MNVARASFSTNRTGCCLLESDVARSCACVEAAGDTGCDRVPAAGLSVSASLHVLDLEVAGACVGAHFGADSAYRQVAGASSGLNRRVLGNRDVIADGDVAQILVLNMADADAISVLLNRRILF